MQYRLKKGQWEPGQVLQITGQEREQDVRQQTAGTQKKFHRGDLWYKCDDFCREALCETLVSDIIKKSNLHEYVDTVEYEPLLVKTKDTVEPACVSPDFLPKGSQVITYAKALRLLNLSEESDCGTDFLTTLRWFLKQHKESLLYFCCLAELDELTLNEDRHTNNIAFLSGDSIMPAPIFDNGRCFAMNKRKDRLSVQEAIEKTDPRIAELSSFRDAADILEKIAGCGGIGLFRTWYTERDLQNSLGKFDGIYSSDVIDRAEQAVLIQMERAKRYVLSEKRNRKNEELAEAVTARYGEKFKVRIKNGDLYIISALTGTLFVSPNAQVQPTENGHVISLETYLQKNPQGFAIARDINQLVIETR